VAEIFLFACSLSGKAVKAQTVIIRGKVLKGSKAILASPLYHAFIALLLLAKEKKKTSGTEGKISFG